MSAAATSAPDERVARARAGIGLVTLSAVAWSTAGLFTRLIPLDAWTTLFWRGIFGTLTGLVCILVLERRGAWRAFSAMGRGGVAFLLLSTGGMLCFLFALKTTTVAHVAIIYATGPVLSAALAWLTLRERASAATLGATLLAVCGVAITVGAGWREGSLLGDGAAFLMTLFMAAAIVIMRRAKAPIPTLSVACASALLGSLIALPFATPLSVSPNQVLTLALFGATNMGLGLICFMLGAKRIPAAQTALIGALDAPLAPIWVWLAFGETPKLTTVLGGGLVILAVLGTIALDHAKPRS